MRELRQGLAVVFDQVVHGEAVFAGAHRKPEVVLMSLNQYEQLTAARERVVQSAASSMDMEGMPPSEVEIGAARELAAGRIDFAEYRRIVSV